MINELEKKLEELFKSQGLEKCVERWKSTTKYVTKTEEAVINDLTEKQIKRNKLEKIVPLMLEFREIDKKSRIV